MRGVEDPGPCGENKEVLCIGHQQSGIKVAAASVHKVLIPTSFPPHCTKRTFEILLSQQACRHIPVIEGMRAPHSTEFSLRSWHTAYHRWLLWAYSSCKIGWS